MKIVQTTTAQNVFRILLGLIMLYIGIGHLSFRRLAFQAQVPEWVMFDKDFVVLVSGIIEIIFGLLMIWGREFKVKTGITLAIFYVLIFPGNIHQYINGIDSLRLDTDTKRLVRLFFQPVLILWALWSTGAIQYLKRKKEK